MVTAMAKISKILLVLALAACGHGAPAGNRYELRGELDGKLVTLVAVTADGRVVQLPDAGLTQTGLTMRDRAIAAPTGAVELACKDGQLFEGTEARAKLGVDAFDYLTTHVAIAPDGTMTIARPGDPVQHVTLVGVAPHDTCTAALLFFAVPVPRAG
jgi:hypothetical protein